VRNYAGGGACTNTAPPSAADLRKITNGAPYPTITPLFVRVKVCDETNFPETQTRCSEYTNGSVTSYKPEGIIQENSTKMRFGAFGYLLDGNQSRDGGVLRARMKDVGPLKPVPGSTPLTNANAEWLSTNGTYVSNPDTADAATSGVANSGVIQYLNKFGRLAGYKSFDPYSELYAEVLKYFKKQNPTSSYSSGLNAAMVDGFPVITNWNDPIQYACQKNFIVGIADSNTHKDKNLSGGISNAENEPAPPSGLDTDYNVATLTNTVGSLETPAMNSLANFRNCCNGSAYLAGLAYYAHTTDLRSDFSNKDGKQTITSYFVDVREAGSWGTSGDPRNQLWLASKFGGFRYSQADNVSNSPVVFDTGKLWANPASGLVQNQPVPSNYFAANQPDKLVNGLRSAFKDINALIGSAAGGSLASTDVSLLGANNAFYKVQYNTSDWTGNIQAIGFTAIAADGTFTTDIKWDANVKIEAQVANNFASRVVITAVPGGSQLGQEFTLANLSATQKSALGGNATEQQEIIDYVRGDRSKEILTTTGVLNPAGKYRTRKYLLGDIVDSEAVYVGAPDAEYDDALNPGYSAFKSAKASRRPLLYVGANDGMLHAIDADTTASTPTSGTGGKEVFAFIPSAVYRGPDNSPATSGLRSLANDPFSHHFFVNAKPTVKDVDFDRAGTPTGSGTADWRTILVGGLGKGGKSFYAIDITDPSQLAVAASAAGKVLWEFADEDMGSSYGLPVITKTRKWGWVVLLTSGYNNITGTDVTKRGKGFLYVLNPKTGALLKKVTMSAGSATDPSGFTQIAPYVPSAASAQVDEVYGGDLLGNLWRIDFKDAAVDPSPTKLAEFKDPVSNNPQPVTTAPVIDYSANDKKRYVFVGTGRYLDSSDSSRTQVQSFYALRDGSQQARFEDSASPTLGLAVPTGVTFPLTRSQLANNSDLTAGLTTAQIEAKPMGWYFDLPGVTATGNVRERISVQPKAEALGVIAWVGTLPETDACNPNGRSFTYKASFGSGLTQLYTKDASGLITKQSSIETSELVKIQTVNINGETATLGSSASGDPFKIGPSSYKVGSGRYLNWRELLQ
jgi:type IV pilus assembly protein PilY1